MLLKGLAAALLSMAAYLCIPESLVGKIVCPCMIYSVVCISKSLGGRRLAWLEGVGGRAFVIYFYSWPVQAVVEMLVVAVAGGGWLAAYPAMFAGGLLGPLLAREAYERKMKGNWFLDRMMGVRQR